MSAQGMYGGQNATKVVLHSRISLQKLVQRHALSGRHEWQQPLEASRKAMQFSQQRLPMLSGEEVTGKLGY